MLATAVASLGIGSPNVALPELAASLNASYQSVEWVILSYQIASMVLGVGAGRLSDILGHRRVFCYGAALFTAAALACGFAPTLGWLIALRGLQGVAGVAMSATTLVLMRDVMPSNRAGTGMGLLGTSIGIGSALGPAVGGFAMAVAGWRGAFLILAPCGLLALILVTAWVPVAARPSGAGRSSFDWLGTLLLGAGISAYALSVTLGAGQFGAINGILGISAIAIGGLFLYSQSRVASPLVRPSAWRDPILRTGLLINVLINAVMMAYFVVAPFYLSAALGLTGVQLGVALAVSPCISVLTGTLAGRVVDRLGASRMGQAGIGLMFIGACGLALLPPVWGLTGFFLPLICFTPGFQLFLAANNTAVMAVARSGERGVTSGMLNLSRSFGFITGTAVLGSVFAASTSDAVSSAPISNVTAATDGMRQMMLIGAGLLIAALVLSAGARTPPPQRIS